MIVYKTYSKINCFLTFPYGDLFPAYQVEKGIGGDYILKKGFFGVVAVLIILLSVVSGCEKETQDVSPEPTNTGDSPHLSESEPLPDNQERYNEYNVSLDVNPAKRTISGVEKVTFFNDYGIALDEIYFNVYFNAFSEDNPVKPYFDEFEERIFGGEDVRYGYFNILNVSVNGADSDFELNNTILEVKLKEPLPPGGITEITLQFESYVPKIRHRTGANNFALWLGNFIPILAVYRNSEWVLEGYLPAGEPFLSDVANYSIKVTTPFGYTVVGTGAPETSVLSEEIKLTELTSKMVRDAAISISNSYQVKTVEIEPDFYINFYYYSNINNADEILNAAAKCVKYYSSNVGAYPYQYLNIVETEQFVDTGAQYPQMVFMDTSLIKSGEFTNTLSYGIGRQWFYNIVGSDRINEAWLHEGLNTFISLGAFYSDREIMQIMSDKYNELTKTIPLIKNRKLNTPISNYDSWKDYENIQKVKASLMFYSLKEFMGNEPFTKLIKTYYAENCYKFADSGIFTETAESVYGGVLTEFFNRWINEGLLPPLIWNGS